MNKIFLFFVKNRNRIIGRNCCNNVSSSFTYLYYFDEYYRVVCCSIEKWRNLRGSNIDLLHFSKGCSLIEMVLFIDDEMRKGKSCVTNERELHWLQSRS